jgi:hypothetical protein
MKRTIAFLSLAIVMTFAVAAQSASQSNPEQLSKKQLNALIASARTAADHNRIAVYYQEKATEFRAQAQEHESMVAAYKANTTLSNDKNRVSTIDHCRYFVTTLNASADKNRELAILHERMAREASVKLVASRQ